MTRQVPMQVAVVLSMKAGLDLFVYRELDVLARNGASLSLFPTKSGKGLYQPRDEWRVFRWSLGAIVFAQMECLLRRPGAYFSLLREALAYGAIADGLLAVTFARQMATADVIYAIVGDRKLFIGYFCKLLMGKPLVVTIHAYELYRNPNPRLFKRALAACDQVITVTEYNRELLATRWGLSPERTEVVRVGLDTDDYRPVDKFVILIVAFFDERKGHETLFRAVRSLGREDIEVWVVGGSAGRAESVDVRALARDLGVSDQVAFFGELSGAALAAVYRVCDVFCHPSRHSSSGVAEGFPTTIMEAMAFGKPVITTRHVEIPRIVPEILVDENDVEGLAKAIESVYQSEPLRRRLASQNRAIAERLFSLKNAERTADILARVAADYHRD